MLSLICTGLENLPVILVLPLKLAITSKHIWLQINIS